MGSRQIVLVSTAGISVLNAGIFWREAKKKAFFTVHSGPQHRQTHRVSARLREEAEGSRGLDHPGPQHRQTHRVSAGPREEVEVSRGLDNPGPQHRQTHRVSAGLREKAEVSGGWTILDPKTGRPIK
jgi:hypothetical protein